MATSGRNKKNGYQQATYYGSLEEGDQPPTDDEYDRRDDEKRPLKSSDPFDHHHDDPSSSQAANRNRILLIGGIAVVVVLGLILVLGVYLSYSESESELGWRPRIQRTQEYQVDLDQQVWAQRDAAVRDFQAYLAGLAANPKSHAYFYNPANPLTLKLDQQTQRFRVWQQKTFDTSTKDFSRLGISLRTRNYLISTGNGTNSTHTTRLDFKFRSANEAVAFAMPMEPMPDHRQGSKQKVEQDFFVNAAFSTPVGRFGHTSKVYTLPFQKELTTIGEGRQIYGGLNYFLPTYADSDPLKITANKFMWVLSFEWNTIGVPPHQTKLESIIYLVYDSYEDALAGVTPPGNPEWSFRVYSTNNGDGEWDPVILEQCMELYNIVTHGPWSYAYRNRG